MSLSSPSRHALVTSVEFAAQLKGVVTIPLLTRLLAPAEYAAYAQVLALVALTMPLITLATDAALLGLLPGIERERQRREFSAWLAGVGTTALAASVLLYLLNPWLARAFIGDAPGAQAYVLVAVVPLWSLLFQQAVRVWLRISGQWIAYSLFGLAVSLFSLAAIVAAWWLGLDGVRLIVLIAALEIAACVFAVLRLVKDRAFARPDFGRTRAMLAFALPTVPSTYAAWCVNFVDRLAVIYFVGLAAAGYLALGAGLAYAAVRLIGVPIFLTYSYEAAIAANSADRGTLRGAFHHAAATAIVLTLPAVAGSFVVADPLIATLATPAYQPAALIFPILVLGYTFQLWGSIAELALQLTGRTMVPLVVSGLVVATVIGLNLVLVPLLSFPGAAIATAGAFALSAGYAFARAHAAGLVTELRPVFVRAAVASIVMAAGCASVRSTLTTPAWLELVLVIGAGLVIYTVMAFVPRIGLIHDPAVAAWFARSRAALPEPLS